MTIVADWDIKPQNRTEGLGAGVEIFLAQNKEEHLKLAKTPIPLSFVYKIQNFDGL